jgi:hypothetical protein
MKPCKENILTLTLMALLHNIIYRMTLKPDDDDIGSIINMIYI